MQFYYDICHYYLSFNTVGTFTMEETYDLLDDTGFSLIVKGKRLIEIIGMKRFMEH